MQQLGLFDQPFRIRSGPLAPAGAASGRSPLTGGSELPLERLAVPFRQLRGSYISFLQKTE
jgi:hypothetical protein